MSAVGNGATFTAVWNPVGSAFTCTLIDATSPTFTVPKVGDSNLATTGHEEFIQGKLVDPGEFSATIEFDVLIANLWEIHFSGVTTQLLLRGQCTGTITYPNVTGLTNAANLSGTGFFTKFSFPSLSSNGKMTCSMTFAFDGKTGPVFDYEEA